MATDFVAGRAYQTGYAYFGYLLDSELGRSGSQKFRGTKVAPDKRYRRARHPVTSRCGPYGSILIEAGPASRFVEELHRKDIYMLPSGSDEVRAVLYLDIKRQQVEDAVKAITDTLKGWNEDESEASAAVLHGTERSFLS